MGLGTSALLRLERSLHRSLDPPSTHGGSGICRPRARSRNRRKRAPPATEPAPNHGSIAARSPQPPRPSSRPPPAVRSAARRPARDYRKDRHVPIEGVGPRRYNHRRSAARAPGPRAPGAAQVPPSSPGASKTPVTSSSATGSGSSPDEEETGAVPYRIVSTLVDGVVDNARLGRSQASRVPASSAWTVLLHPPSGPRPGDNPRRFPVR